MAAPDSSRPGEAAAGAGELVNLVLGAPAPGGERREAWERLDLAVLL